MQAWEWISACVQSSGFIAADQQPRSSNLQQPFLIRGKRHCYLCVQGTGVLREVAIADPNALEEQQLVRRIDDLRMLEQNMVAKLETLRTEMTLVRVCALAPRLPNMRCMAVRKWTVGQWLITSKMGV